VAVQTVALACTLPDEQGRSLAQWDCAELARQLVAEGVVATISRETVRRILAAHALKPWRHHPWLHPRTPRDAAFFAAVAAVCTVLTRPLAPGEVVLSVDEKTSLQPRPRRHPTRPATPAQGDAPAHPIQVEHEYTRDGALTLFAAFDTRTGRVVGQCHRRKRAAEFLAFLAHLDDQFGPDTTRLHLVLDNVQTHKTKAVQAWLAAHPRFVLHFTPVHCSWLNPVEQWFSVLQRKRLRLPAFASLDDLHLKLRRFIAEWNERAHPFAWRTTSAAKVMAKAPPEVLAAIESAADAATTLAPAA
jgi:transposase